MSSVLSARSTCRMRQGLRTGRGHALAGWPRVPPLRRARAHLQDAGQEHPDRRLQVLRLPQAVHASRSAPSSRTATSRMRIVAAGDLSAGVQQEGHQRQPASPHLGRHASSGLVHAPPHPRSHARWPPRAADGRRRRRSSRSTRRSTAALRPIPRAAGPIGAEASPTPRTRTSSCRWSSAAARCAATTSPAAPSSEVIPIVNANVAKEAAVMTDKAQLYKYRLGDFASHDRVDHSKEEYARYEEGRPVIHTNTVEGYFSRVQARHARHLPALQRKASAPVSGGVRFPLQQPRRAWREDDEQRADQMRRRAPRASA